jgi:acetolactate synthase-1/2/3 large subunit
VSRSRTGGQILVDQLVVHGVDHLFCVPGESYLAVLDALHDAPIAVTVCRQEGGAAMMADAYGKLTARPGICFVTRGPGATNAAHGVHIARHDSTPLILFVGQVARGMRGREAFQEMDFSAFFGSLAKWVVEIDDPARIPELVSRAFHVATAARPGPVVVSLPEDMLTEAAVVADAPAYAPVEIHPAAAEMEELGEMLAASARPLAILGGSRWSESAVSRFASFAERFAIPVVCSFRRQMLFPADHPCYAGDLGISPNPKLLAMVKESELVLLVGGRLSEVPSQGYTLLDIPAPRQKLVHIHADAAELGRVYPAKLAINASPGAFASVLERLRGTISEASHARVGAAHADYLSWSDPDLVTSPGRLRMPHVMRVLRDRLPADTIIANGAGNFAGWVNRFWPYRSYGTQLAPTSGSMGYSVPPAVAAKRLHPQRIVVAFAGDGDFLMNGQEFATAVQYDLPVLVVVVDNGMYGTIRMHQEKHYPGRVSATDLKNPDFSAYARAFGGHGERVVADAEFAPALERALASGKPALLHCLIDKEAITPVATLSEIREKALAKAN